MDLQNYKPKGFFQRPEGITGILFAGGMVAAAGWFALNVLPTITDILNNTLYFGLSLTALAALVYAIIDPRLRNLVGYAYSGIMRFITGIFINLDPIGIMEGYIDELKKNLGKMNTQIGNLRGQMQKLGSIIKENQRQISQNMQIADAAKKNDKQAIMVLKSRAAGRLQDSNVRLDDLYKKMEIMHRVLVKMYENSEIMAIDLEDQVKVKKIERSAIQATHSAMNSAMSILSGDPDRKKMFDLALEAVNDDVSQKIGEMQRFMDLSSNFMSSIDLQNGVFEEEGMKMLEQWEKEGVSRLLGEDKNTIVRQGNSGTLDLNAPKADPQTGDNKYDSFF
jgi:hypothetical protein